MSTAVMTTNAIYDFGDLLLKQKQSSLGSSSASSTSSQSAGMRWEQRAPGSPMEHEPLARRASHPVGPTMASLVTSLLLDINQHRRLDRSQSDPAKSLVNVNTSRYKTELCRPYEESGECKYGDKCQFAHGFNELRNLVRHPKYKTELCRTFHTVGFCPYGPRCHFIHNAEEARLGKSRPRPLCLLPAGPGSSADTPSPPSSLGSVSPPPSSSTSNTAFSFAPDMSPCQSPPPPPGSPDQRLPVFNRLSHNPADMVLAFQFGGELLA